MIEHRDSLTSITGSFGGELLLFRTLWNNSNDNMFIVTLDKDGDFINEANNKALLKTFKLKAEQIEGLKLQDFLDPQTYKTVTDRYKECISLDIPITYDESATIDESGERFWNTTILPVKDKENDSVKIFGISREFTKLKRVEKELYLVNETLESKVKDRTIELQEALEKMKKLSATDKLTGLFNRSKLDEILDLEIKRSKRYSEVFGIILLDIDYFKDVNDTHGHQVGDLILKEIAGILESNARNTDMVGRWGGEEFLIICPKTDVDGIYQLSQHIREKIQSSKFSHIKQKTASFGITSFKINDNSVSILKRADDALYKAKANGRNCVIAN